LAPGHSSHDSFVTESPHYFSSPGVTPIVFHHVEQHRITVKDGVVISFVLGLWLYSIYLMFRFNCARVTKLGEFLTFGYFLLGYFSLILPK
jgi:hypothetical protein